MLGTITQHDRIEQVLTIEWSYFTEAQVVKRASTTIACGIEMVEYIIVAVGDVEKRMFH